MVRPSGKRRLSAPMAWTLAAAPLTAFAVCIPALIVWRHRANIARLLAGTEPAVTQRRLWAGAYTLLLGDSPSEFEHAFRIEAGRKTRVVMRDLTASVDQPPPGFGRMVVTVEDADGHVVHEVVRH